jgi:2-oxoglutarate dehydrogenase E1 component
MAAEDNIQVVYPTTPAQCFHLLRRQVLRKIRKPLVVMSPKSLLRHPKVVSSLDEVASESFQRILPDAHVEADVERILLCSGKVYYDLVQHRSELKRADVAILRLEQLYPLPDRILEQALAPYGKDLPIVWVQEEPENMGALRYLHARFERHLLGHPLSYVSRPGSASPATGSHNSHKQEQEQFLSEAFNRPLDRKPSEENGAYVTRPESARRGRIHHGS